MTHAYLPALDVLEIEVRCYTHTHTHTYIYSTIKTQQLKSVYRGAYWPKTGGVDDVYYIILMSCTPWFQLDF